MVKIAVLVSGGGTNLQALIDREQQGELGSGKICLVLSSRPDVYALERAKKAGIESIVVDRKQCSSPEQFSAKVLEQLQSRGIEMVVLAGFLSILCKDMVQAYPNRPRSATFPAYIITITAKLSPPIFTSPARRCSLSGPCTRHRCPAPSPR